MLFVVNKWLLSFCLLCHQIDSIIPLSFFFLRFLYFVSFSYAIQDAMLYVAYVPRLQEFYLSYINLKHHFLLQR